MQFNQKFFSLPPYISTSWNNISTIHMKGNLLVVTLRDGDCIHIPGLQPEITEAIFNAHAAYLEKEPALDQQITQSKINPIMQALGATDGAEIPFRFGFGPADNMGSVLQHNPAQAGAPDLPKEVLNKISAIAKIVAPEDLNAVPKPEPHCNCFHCQIARAVNQGLSIVEEVPHVTEEPAVNDTELTFCQWDVIPKADHLYTVVNRLDDQERYNVYLGNPMGCTCGNDGCEHIIAVLKT